MKSMQDTPESITAVPFRVTVSASLHLPQVSRCLIQANTYRNVLLLSLMIQKAEHHQSASEPRHLDLSVQDPWTLERM